MLGEVIGDVVETEVEKVKPQRGRGQQDIYMGRFAAQSRLEEKTNVPEMIDYSTGAVMVDAMPISDWFGTGTLRTRHYYDMLYSVDGINIEHMPVGTAYWSKNTQSVFNYIAKLEREPQEPFKDFGSGGRRRGRTGQGEYDDMGLYDEMMYEQDMMMEGMGGGRGRY